MDLGGVRGSKTAAWLVRLGWISLVIVALLYSYKIFTNPNYSDFLVYHRTAERLIAGQWDLIYNLEQDGNSPFRYAPPTLLWFLPWGFIPYAWSKLLWFWLNLGCFVVSFGLLARMIAPAFATVQTLQASQAPRAAALIALTWLASLRFLIDSFTIGQVTGLMFLSLTIALKTYVRGQPPVAGSIALSVPALLKIGTGLLYLLPGVHAPSAARRLKDLGLSLSTALVSVLVLGGLNIAMIWTLGTESVANSVRIMNGFCRSWLILLGADSQFFDSAHYGTQSLNSALLRAASWGLFGVDTAKKLHMGLGVFAVIAVLALWWRKRPVGLPSRMLFFSVGIMAYLLLMPFTFKYSVPLEAIPVLALLVRSQEERLLRLTRISLLLGLFTLSLAGLDVVGETLFFAIQKASLPALAHLLIAVSVYREAWRASL